MGNRAAENERLSKSVKCWRQLNHWAWHAKYRHRKQMRFSWGHNLINL